MKAIRFLATALLVGSTAVSVWANPIPLGRWFARVYDSLQSDVARCIIQPTGDGAAVIVAGSTTGFAQEATDALLIFLDHEGHRQSELCLTAPGDDEIRGMAETTDHSILVVGSTHGGQDEEDAFVALVSAQGQLVWERVWSGGVGRDEAWNAVICGPDGIPWIVGYTGSFTGNGRKEAVVARIAPDGRTLTGCRFALPSEPLSDALGLDLAPLAGAAGIAVTGSVGPAGAERAYVAAFDSDLLPLWGRIFEGSDQAQRGKSIIATTSGGLVVGGESDVLDETVIRPGGFVVATGADGWPVWGSRHIPAGALAVTRIDDLVLTPYGEVVAVGRHWDQLAQPPRDIVVEARWAADGYLLSNRGYDLGPQGGSTAISTDRWSEMHLAGTVLGQEPGGVDAYVVKTLLNGTACLPDIGGPPFSSWLPACSAVDLAPTTFTTTLADGWLQPFPPDFIDSPRCSGYYRLPPSASWTFDECDGDQVHDVSGHAFGGVKTGGTWVPNPAGCALRIVDANDGVRGIPEPCDNESHWGFTVLATFNWYGPTGSPCYLFDAISEDRGFRLSIGDDGRVTFEMPGVQTLTSQGSVSVGGWTCLQATYDWDWQRMTISINGQPSGMVGVLAPYRDVLDPVALGNSALTGDPHPFHGEIDQVTFCGSYDMCPSCPSWTSSLEVTSPPCSVYLQAPQPNPAVGPLTLRFGLPAPSMVNLTIWSVDGRQVATVLAGPQTDGEHHVVWDGRDRDGRGVLSGIYLARLRTDHGEQVQKICCVR